MNRRVIPILSAGILALGLGAGLSRAASSPQAATQAANYTVTVGWGDRGFAANIFTPEVIQIYAGDSVTFRSEAGLEPHTVTFGPMSLLSQLNPELFIPQKAGPPIVALNPKVADPTPGHIYNGSGFANSGFLNKGQSWTETFSKPGTYHYYCILHYDPSPNGPKMSGVVVVNPRPAAGHTYVVTSGYDNKYSAADSFFPRHLTIHAGDSVEFTPGFHTVAFGPDSERTYLEKHLYLPIPQKNGPPLLAFNPKVVFPSGGNVYNGSGFLNSGVMLPTDPNAKPSNFKVTFTKPGTYEFDCLLHPGMDGTVTVLP